MTDLKLLLDALTWGRTDEVIKQQSTVIEIQAITGCSEEKATDLCLWAKVWAERNFDSVSEAYDRLLERVKADPELKTI